MAKPGCFWCLNSHLMTTNPTRRPPIPIFDNLKVSGALTPRELQRSSSVPSVEAIQRDYKLNWQFLVSYDGVAR